MESLNGVFIRTVCMQDWAGAGEEDMSRVTREFESWFLVGANAEVSVGFGKAPGRSSSKAPLLIQFETPSR